ncbi:hypothetical protein [Azospirillum doebereinerae]|uniref:Uncharacterized protein n=1 Tax=Azospirillum doebereinerae TaxID=92933 RepID=A0A433J0R8_9PROT|nr:hypothetical protein [Azospirillum doebereinerae]RUQ63092.1 hypothetical protein EJ913_28220 [Azospirillum doebereinerae]
MQEAIMHLLRPPTEDDMAKDCPSIELHSFLQAFRDNSISGFAARIRLEGKKIAHIGTWEFTINPSADWYSIKF